MGTLLDGLIKAVIPSNTPYCNRFDTPQTVDGILRTEDNDAVGTRSSQLGDVQAGHSQWFPNLSHADVPLYKLSCRGCVTDNVKESPDVWQAVCQWLSPGSSCLPLVSATDVSALQTAPSNKNAGLSTNLTPVSTSPTAASARSTVPMPHVVTKNPHAVDRLAVRAPAGLELGKPFDLTVNTGSGGLPEIHVVQSSETGTQKEVPAFISRIEGQTVHLNVTPKFHGATRFQVTAAYPDGGIATKDFAANVGLPRQDGLQADELPVAGIPLVVPGRPFNSRNPTLRLQPWTWVDIPQFETRLVAYLAANEVTFAIDPPSGSAFIDLDPTTGIIRPRKAGTATVKVQYNGQFPPLTSQVQVNVVPPQQ